MHASMKVPEHALKVSIFFPRMFRYLLNSRFQDYYLMKTGEEFLIIFPFGRYTFNL